MTNIQIYEKINNTLNVYITIKLWLTACYFCKWRRSLQFLSSIQCYYTVG